MLKDLFSLLTIIALLFSSCSKSDEEENGDEPQPTEETALNELELFKDKWDSKYPKIYKSWHDNWATLSTYFKYPEAVRRLIYTTNEIGRARLNSSHRSQSRMPSSA